MTGHKLECEWHPPAIIEAVSQGITDYRLGKQQADNYLSETFFPLTPISLDTKERMVKLAATTLLMQRLNCRLLGITPTPVMENQFILVGAIIDPYDGVIDDKDLDRSVQFCNELSNSFLPGWHAPESSPSDPPNENRFYHYFKVLEQEIPRDEYQGFWKALKAMHMIQTISLLQRRDTQSRLGIGLDREELFELSEVKGGLNAILFAALIDPTTAETIPDVEFPPTLTMQDLEPLRRRYVVNGNLYLSGYNRLADAMYTAGAFIQHVDDFEDVPDDKIEGIQTAFTLDSGMTLQFLRDLPLYIRNIRSQFIAAGKNKKDTEVVLYYLGLYLTRKILKRVKKLK